MSARRTLGWATATGLLLVVLGVLYAGRDEGASSRADPMVSGRETRATSPPSRLSGGLSIGGVKQRRLPSGAGSRPPDSRSSEIRFDCAQPAPQSWTEADMEAARAEGEALRARWLERLDAAEDPDLRLAAALFLDEDDPERLELLWSAVEAGDERPLTLHRLLTTCLAQPAAGRCADHRIVSRAIAADPHNGAMWVTAAAWRLGHDEPQAALEAMERAAAASTHREYFIDAVLVYEQGLAAASDLGYSERVPFAIALEAATPIPFTRLSRACSERVEADSVWRGTCAELGRSTARRAHTMLGQLLGLELRRMTAEAGGDGAESAEVSERVSELMALMRDDRRAEAETVRRNDDRFARAYLDEWRTRGEAAALRSMMEEVDRLKRIPGYDPCRGKAAPPGQ
ncbi:hypothetical protein [Lentisalinibacter salinarum]|uniref:hypothetical protein n=1 Tax=Lentisalinibacter salinarum TaxID=2992239 RepID=UPI003864F690